MADHEQFTLKLDRTANEPRDVSFSALGMVIDGVAALFSLLEAVEAGDADQGVDVGAAVACKRADETIPESERYFWERLRLKSNLEEFILVVGAAIVHRLGYGVCPDCGALVSRDEVQSAEANGAGHLSH